MRIAIPRLKIQMLLPIRCQQLVAVMGYLHMTEDIARLEELIAWCIDEVEKEI